MGTDSRVSAVRFRELVALVLRSEGVTAADGSDISPRAQGAVRLSSRLQQPEEARSDILGLDQWLLSANYGFDSRDLSASVDRAVELAELDGKTYAAAIWPRKGRPASEFYAVLPLKVLADLIQVTEQLTAENVQHLRQMQQQAIAAEQLKREQLEDDTDAEQRAEHEAAKAAHVRRLLYGDDAEVATP